MSMFAKQECPRVKHRGHRRSDSGMCDLRSLWWRDVTAAARSMLHGGWRNRTNEDLPNETVSTDWSALVVEPGTDDKQPVQHANTLWCLTNPVAPEEVKAALVGVAGISGPGGVSWASLKGIPMAALSSLFNTLKLAGVSSGGNSQRNYNFNSQDPGTWWAIPATPNNCNFNSWQTVRPYPGQLSRAGNNDQPTPKRIHNWRWSSHVCQSLLTHAKTSGRPLALVFLDIKGAYNNVLQDFLQRLCVRLGAPQPIRLYLRSLYRQSRAQFSYGGQILSRGVRQGTPGSCALFNAVMDLVTGSIRADMGAKFSEGVRVSHLLFADDTVPVANTPELLQVCLRKFIKELEAGQLVAKPQEQCCTGIAPLERQVGVDSSMSITDSAGTTLPMLGVKDSYKYPGLQLRCEGIKWQPAREQYSQ